MKFASVSALFVSVFLAVAFVACGGGDDRSDNGGDDIVTGVDVVYDHGAGDIGTDTRPDEGGVDTAVPDIGSDVVVDAWTDVGADVGVDVTVFTDVTADAAADVTPDAADAADEGVYQDTGDEVTDFGFDTGFDAIYPDPYIEPWAPDMYFPYTIPGCTSDKLKIRISNLGTGALVITDIWFDVQDPAIQMTGVPAEFPHEVAPGGEDSIDLQLSFSPSAEGEYLAVICLAGNGFQAGHVCSTIHATASACTDGSHKCGCQCADDSAVATCGARCNPCTTAVSGAVPTCEPSGETFVCGIECAEGFHQCASSCKSDTDPNACGPDCTLCYSQANSTRVCRDGACALECTNGWDDCDGVYTSGCEESLATTTNCGVCRRACITAPTHGVATCENYECSFDCLSGYHEDGTKCSLNNLDGCCGDDGPGGTCVNCAFMQTPMPPNTTGVCVGLIDFSCELVCQDGWFSTSGGINDGCECHFVSAYDQPGNGIDENCDGNDARPDLAWYVSTTGSDSNDGSAGAPFRTIQKAVNSAQSAYVRKRVFIAAGTYTENVVIRGPVSLFGGLSSDGAWTYSDANVTTIRAIANVGARTMGVDGADMTTETWIGGLTIVAGPETQGGDGADVVGIKCSNCPALGIANVKITAGPGGDVTAVPVGATGATGGAGSIGDYMITGGAGGVSGCGREGGVGGDGGFSGSGLDGLPGNIVGAGGGAGGEGGIWGSVGTGGTGASCTTVGQDRGGAQTIGAASGGYWLGSPGTNGDDGCSGHGGGGGGGGSGDWDSEYTYYGSGGGGGGAGGCAGQGGPGGKAGGASMGIFLHQSTGATISNCIISAADAGNGGVGGAGGAGGSGGAGGARRQGESGYYSGTGGAGGGGSAGGKGGGGAGGVSFAVYLSDTVLALPATNTLSHGQPGIGGSTSGVKNAVDGIAGDFNQ